MPASGSEVGAGSQALWLQGPLLDQAEAWGSNQGYCHLTGRQSRARSYSLLEGRISKVVLAGNQCLRG